MGNEMVQVNEMEAPMTALAMRTQVNLIQQVMKEVMLGPSKENPEGVHYGVIPGCKKPSLFKAGAEKLAMVFRLRPVMNNVGDVVITALENGHREVMVYCHIMSASGQELATGVGSCSTMESKYRYQGGQKIPTTTPIPKEYWNLKNEGKFKEAQDLIGGKGFGAGKNDSGEWVVCEIGEKQENPNIADTYNTVLKMAKKRAQIDGTLTATGASDIFTQDVEDFAKEGQSAAAPKSATSKYKHSAASACGDDKGGASKAQTPGVITAVVEKYYAPKPSKNNPDKNTPHQILVGGKYYSTYDEELGHAMSLSQGREAEIHFRTENYRGRDNNIIEEILPIVAAETGEETAN